jgi:hypothetical protein
MEVRRPASRRNASPAHQALGADEAERGGLALSEPLGETTHWTGVLMAKTAGLNKGFVHADAVSALNAVEGFFARRCGYFP